MSEIATNERPSKSIGRRIWDFFKALLITLFLLTILSALAAGAYLGFQELQRSFTNVYARIDLLRSDVNTLMETAPVQDQELDELRAGLETSAAQLNVQIEDQGERIDSLETSLAEDLDAQAETLLVLEANLGNLQAELSGVMTHTGSLEESLVALQGDVNENTSQIDTFGGDVDAVRADVVTLDGTVAEAQTTAETAAAEARAALVMSDTVQVEVAEMQQTLTLFRAWSIISRARLRLLEDNVGLATSDVELAAALLDELIQTAPEADLSRLAQAQSRLQLALTNLAANPAGAALDLEQAWNDLDAILAVRLGLPQTPENPEG